MIVMKFGGSSVANADRVKHVASIIKSYADKRPVVVLSAMGDTTDYLLDAAEAKQQLVGCFLSDAGDVGQRGAEGALRALLLVVGDGETMHLVLYLFQKVEQLVGGFESHDAYLPMLVVT